MESLLKSYAANHEVPVVGMTSGVLAGTFCDVLLTFVNEKSVMS